jgi:hypothetical protein
MVRLLNLDFVDACASMVCTFHWRDAINHINTKFYYDNQSQGTVTRGNETRRELLKKTGSTYASTTRETDAQDNDMRLRHLQPPPRNLHRREQP